MTFVTPVDGQPAIAEHVAQLTETLSAGRSIPVYIRELEVMSRSAVIQGLELFVQPAAMANPATGYSLLYAKDDGKLWLRNDAGAESQVGGGVTLPLTQHLTFSPDNTYDIGAAAASRPRDLYLAGKIVQPTTVDNSLGRTGVMGGTDPSYALRVNGAAWFATSITFNSMSTTGGGTFGGPVQAQYFIGPEIRSSSGQDFNIVPAGNQRWVFAQANGELRPTLDNAVDLGNSTKRPRDLFLGRDLTLGGHILGAFDLNGTSVIRNSTTNAMTYLNVLPNGTNSWATLQIFGGANATVSNNKRLALNQFDADSSIITGSASTSFQIGTYGAVTLGFLTNNTNRWSISGTGHLLAGTDNAYDIGATGATRPRTIYAATSVVTPAVTSGDSSNLTLNVVTAGYFLQLATAGTNRWYIHNSGHLRAATDNAYDIGTTGFDRPRDLFLGRNLVLNTSSRILGDFSNATIASRTMFQTSTSNQPTYVGLIPNGVWDQASLHVYSGSDPNNSPFLSLSHDSNYAYVVASKNGTGSYKPLVFQAGGAERMRIDTGGSTQLSSARVTQNLALGTGAGLELLYDSVGSNGAYIQAYNRSGALYTDVHLHGKTIDVASWNGGTVTFTVGGAERLKIETDGTVACWGDTAIAGLNGAQTPTNATTGFAYLPACSGVPTAIPAMYGITLGRGHLPLIVDQTNMRLYVYIGGWRMVQLT